MECKNCPYYWRDNANGGNPYCHYRWDDGYAPCEVYDRDRETEDD